MQAEISGASIPVICLSEVDASEVSRCLEQVGMVLETVADGAAIPGSFWGDEEAGLIENRLYARGDTPLHSILHEACHWLCMDEDRRLGVHTNAGGDYDEENAVCYLQILLADRIAGFGSQRCMIDMDRWGYSFRLGSASAWFHEDAEDARVWLVKRGILDSLGLLQI